MQDGETEWNRGVSEIGAAQVEQPRDVGRVGDDQRILLAVGKRLADFSAFVFRASAGIGQRVGTRRVGGRLGPVAPDPVNRIGVHRFHPQPGLAKAGKALRAGQPGIVADTGVRGRVSGDPGRGRIVGDVPTLPQCGIGLGLDLQSIAPIGEHGGAVRQHHSQAGAAGKAGEPGEALGGGGDVFAKMLIGPGDQEPLQVPSRQFSPQG